MVTHHPETFPPPLVVGARLADHVAEHVVVGVFFLQAVPEHKTELTMRHILRAGQVRAVQGHHHFRFTLASNC